MPKSRGNATRGNRSGKHRSDGDVQGLAANTGKSGGKRNEGNSVVAFLRTLAPGTTDVNIQFDGGGVSGVFVGTFQGTDGRGNFLFTDLTSRTDPTISFPGITRISPDEINAASR